MKRIVSVLLVLVTLIMMLSLFSIFVSAAQNYYLEGYVGDVITVTYPFNGDYSFPDYDSSVLRYMYSEDYGDGDEIVYFEIISGSISGITTYVSVWNIGGEDYVLYSRYEVLCKVEVTEPEEPEIPEKEIIYMEYNMGDYFELWVSPGRHFLTPLLTIENIRFIKQTRYEYYDKYEFQVTGGTVGGVIEVLQCGYEDEDYNFIVTEEYRIICRDDSPQTGYEEIYINLRIGDTFTITYEQGRESILTPIMGLGALTLSSAKLNGTTYTYEFFCWFGNDEGYKEIIDVGRENEEGFEEITRRYIITCYYAWDSDDELYLWLKSIVDKHTKGGNTDVMGAMYELYEIMRERVNNARAEGYSDGRTAGYEEGYKRGYEDGKKDGAVYLENEYSIYNLIRAIINTPVDMVKNIINFEIELPNGGSLNLWYIVTFLISILLAGFVIKKLI